MNPELPDDIRAEVTRASRDAATGRRLCAALAHGDDDAVHAIVSEIATGNRALYVIMSLAVDQVALARTCYRQHATTYLDRQALLQLDIAEHNQRGAE
ncbi:hypothetical protein [Mycolicibacterium palauense]|uniref:hypothetical protein n=1 Tax=Mycolicibacterium palauense TaxID=2034511 RepID=UPI000BFEB3CB|nr:hypothetical protein [Mycolicibacterium palauense]